MNTTDTELNAFDEEMQAKVDATLAGPTLRFKAYGQDAAGHNHFVTFGTPPTYSRDAVRRIAERLFTKHSAHPTLIAIRPDKKHSNWVLRSRIGGRTPVSEGLCR